MSKTKPFRADMVGSLLRTKALKNAREKHAGGLLSAGGLAEIEDREIAALIKQQENIGLEAVTDGEFRRSWWHYDFLFGLKGVTKIHVDQGIQFAGVQTKAEAPKVTGKLDFDGHAFIDHFKFVKANTKSVAKMTIPSPSMLHYRGGRKLIDEKVYPTMEGFYADLGAAYEKCVKQFYDAGCRYLQLDDVTFAYLCDPAQLKMLKDRGDDPTKQPKIYADMINRAVSSRPKDMTVTIHVCRGNFKSTFVASGGYEPIADLLFNQVNVDGYFLEWDNDRSGDLQPLRHLPKGKRVVLGLVTSKTGTLEKADDIRRRIDEAAKYTPLDRLCLSPQCGFASTEEGNTLAEGEQWKKLEMIVDVAAKTWGKA